ncbi:unnamed protein product [Toxocara canis]|uniref:Uncharacterized protein n=1 Tax=Toxocara canis TaxID=6265 RepID=A0A183TX25_TOXCA|nr:unnamed protein product [Toxocara canis]
MRESQSTSTKFRGTFSCLRDRVKRQWGMGGWGWGWGRRWPWGMGMGMGGMYYPYYGMGMGGNCVDAAQADENVQEF